MKVDNDNLAAKLELRRYFLEKYHPPGTARVLDCCQGNGVLWNELRKSHAVKSYTGFDLKPKKGRLRVASERVLAQPGWSADVIDIDTYGAPWKHWLALLPNVREPVTVFMTVGSVLFAVGDVVKESLGLDQLSIPVGLEKTMLSIGITYCLARCYAYRLTPVEVQEAERGRSARYIGIRLEPGDGQHGRHNYCVDESYVQSVDGMHEGKRGMPELLRGNANTRSDGPQPVGSVVTATGDEQAELAKANRVEPRRKRGRRA